jgi:hypothetical protein
MHHHALVADLSYLVSGEVPSPENVAVWAALSMVPIKKVPLWAAHWLVAGYDGESLVYLAGLPGDDSHEMYDALPAALSDCGVSIPESEVAAATVIFGDLARMHLDGMAGPLWIAQKVKEVLEVSGYSSDVIALPLGGIYCVADEWDEGWGRSRDQLTALVREQSAEQLRLWPTVP